MREPGHGPPADRRLNLTADEQASELLPRPNVVDEENTAIVQMLARSDIGVSADQEQAIRPAEN